MLLAGFIRVVEVTARQSRAVNTGLSVLTDRQ